MKLDHYRKSFELSYKEFITANNISSNQIHHDLRYEKITDVTRIDRSDNEFFFFKENALTMIYISHDELAQSLWHEFKHLVNHEAPEQRVRSRAGKTSNQLIFASQGLAASVKHNEVDFIEVYQPCSLQDYLDTIYREPPLFIR